MYSSSEERSSWSFYSTSVQFSSIGPKPIMISGNLSRKRFEYEFFAISENFHLWFVFSAVEDIKNKFKNLRTTFQRQYKMVQASGEGLFIPQWKHYQQLMFLQACCSQEDGANNTPPMVPKEENQFPLTSPALLSFLPSPSSSSSSCAPSGVVGRCFWTEEKERELISFYAGNKQKHPDESSSEAVCS